jgi:predicted TIM-barrel fold metal-dependent hydrolase
MGRSIQENPGWYPVHQMTVDYPERFKGFAIIPMQDVGAAITELDRAVNQLGLVGAIIDDKVNGKTYDEPEFLPLVAGIASTGVKG